MCSCIFSVIFLPVVLFRVWSMVLLFLGPIFSFCVILKTISTTFFRQKRVLGQFSYLHFGIDALRDLVSEVICTGVRLGQ